MMPGPKGKNASRGFTLVEILIVLGIMGILASISIPNFRSYMDKAEVVSVLTTLKYLMDGEDFYFLENDTFYPEKGKLKVSKGEAKEIPELAYNFPEGHKNQYEIKAKKPKKKNPSYSYEIKVKCDFDSNGNGKDDEFVARTEISGGVVKRNREIVQTR